jgi:hypothetical protein
VRQDVAHSPGAPELEKKGLNSLVALGAVSYGFTTGTPACLMERPKHGKRRHLQKCSIKYFQLQQLSLKKDEIDLNFIDFMKQ